MKLAALLSVALFAGSASAQSVAFMVFDDSADCAPMNLFIAADRAASIAIYEARAGRGNITARDVRVAETLRGTAASRLPSGGIPLYRGARYLVFADAAGNTLGACTTIDLSPRALAGWGGDEASIVSALRLFLASSGPARAELLVKLASENATFVAAEAADALSESPALVRDLTPAQQAMLVRALETPIVSNEPLRSSARIPAIARVLARLHVVAAVPGIVRWIGDPHVNPRLLEDALELLTNHHDARYTPGNDISVSALPELRRRWQHFYETHRADSPSALVAAGFAERGLRRGAGADRADLARVIRTGPDHLTRLVAAERCERVRSASFEPGIRAYLHQGDSPASWERIAASCEAP